MDCEANHVIPVGRSQNLEAYLGPPEQRFSTVNLPCERGEGGTVVILNLKTESILAVVDGLSLQADTARGL